MDWPFAAGTPLEAARVTPACTFAQFGKSQTFKPRSRDLMCDISFHSAMAAPACASLKYNVTGYALYTYKTLHKVTVILLR